MTYEEIFEKYMRGLKELRFDECTQVVGILYYQNHEAALSKDVEVNFLTGNYEYVIYLAQTAREKNQSNIEIDEYYYASLALCGRFSTLRRELRKTKKQPISIYCADYIQSIVLNNNEKIYEQFHAIYYEQTAFRRLNLERQIKILVDVLEMQKELDEAYQDNQEEIDNKYFTIDDKIKSITISSEYVNNIKKCISKRIVLDSYDVYNLFCQYIRSEGINAKGEIIAITELRDILCLFDYLRRMQLIKELMNQFCLVEDIVFDAIRRQNKTAASYIKEVYYDLNNYELLYSDVVDMDLRNAICKKCKKILDDYFPEMLTDRYEKGVRTKVFSVLSDTARPMYKAAEWQYRAVLNDNNFGFRDAGMLCLSYIRLLELEMNVRFLPNIRNHYNEIDEKYEENKPSEDTSKKKKKSFEHKWNIVKSFKASSSSISKGLTAGEWGLFLNTMFCEYVENSQSSLYKILYDLICDNILNEKGIEALNDGRFANIFDQNTIVEKYRNPPAHTRYVTLDIANECKHYVEEKLLFMEELFKKI